jgi:hypothetical protein
MSLEREANERKNKISRNSNTDTTSALTDKRNLS